jgi:hypothetical protein
MKPFIAAILAVTVIACGATIKDIGRTINDAADIACTLFAAEHTDALQSLTPRQWCDLKENFDPFLDEILSAQRAAGARLGIQSPPQTDVVE